MTTPFPDLNAKSNVTGVSGWMTHDEEAALIALVKEYVGDGDQIVELGTEYGRSASAMAYAASDKQGVTVCAVDIFPEHHPLVGDLRACWRNNVLDYAQLLFFPQVEVVSIQGDSIGEGYRSWMTELGGSIKFLYVDSKHTYEHVSEELKIWSRRMASGGVIAIHGYAKRDEGVHYMQHTIKQACDDWFARQRKWTTHSSAGSIQFYVKD